MFTGEMFGHFLAEFFGDIEKLGLLRLSDSKLHLFLSGQDSHPKTLVLRLILVVLKLKATLMESTT